jgi:hypothetical protein
MHRPDYLVNVDGLPNHYRIAETVERKQPRRRRSFTPEFKAEIVERCRAGDPNPAATSAQQPSVKTDRG